METYVPAPNERRMHMSASEELLAYILSLTPEQIDKVFNHLPPLTLTPEEPLKPCPQGQIRQIR